MLMCEIRKMNLASSIKGVGGSFNVLPGDKKKISLSWARAKGMEWLYRIFQTPLKCNYRKCHLITNTYFINFVLAIKILLTINNRK
jgi:UDP-N-acetyl-D-mannosaminuronic acid transferase (WecB/TagA/CpsF family)